MVDRFCVRMTTTIKFNGILKKFIIVALVASGTYFPLIVLIAGQNNPTQDSNIKNETNIKTWESGKRTGIIIQALEIHSTPLIKFSGSSDFDKILNNEDPIIMAIINPAKIYPWGIFPACPSICSFAADSNEGVHLRTKVYMPPSNKLWIRPKQIIFWSCLIATYAFLYEDMRSEDVSPKFSVHVKEITTIITIRTQKAKSNGQTKPNLSTAVWATKPDIIAAIELPNVAWENIEPNRSTSNPLYL